ncbi:MAG: hypothetical protein ABJA34_10810 [Pseudonocardiales bacterium]
MIVGHGLSPVRPRQEAEFKLVFATARAIIAAMPGFERLSLSRCIERPSTCCWWSGAGLLHHFYEPLPTVEHFEPVLTV